MNFAIINLGCKVNRVESDTIAAACLARGSHEVDSAAADIIFINTCTVTGEAEKKTRKAVRRALRENTTARVVVTGCAAAIAPEVFSTMGNRVIVEPDKAKVIEAFDELVPLSRHGDSDEQASDKVAVRVGREFPTRAGIKVQDGCNNACTYCIVHVARGPAWNRSINEIVEETVAHARAGVKEIVLSGINLGSFNDEGLSLVELLKAILAKTSGVRFRLSSIEPRDVDDALIALMQQEEGRICRHLHLPLQSGSTEVLRQMARPYTAQAYEDLVQRLYAAMPMLSLSTDIIVGFPGETESQFEETLVLAQRSRFSKIHVFPYSRREGTPAAERIDQIDPHCKAERASRLNQLGEALHEQSFNDRIGGTEQVIVERRGRGTTESYFDISVPAEAVPGDLIELRLERQFEGKFTFLPPSK
ncbi:MAG: tRNA (N(6)-L-threonylcarbamoyladenosine(37)-C(2))-methylthiotransferase MtaB [Raoultibacter sp.]